MLDTHRTDIPEPNALPVMSQDILNKVLEKHAMFLRGQVGGRRASLQYMDLSNLKFHNHDLSQADFTGSRLVGADLSLGTFQTACFFACDLSNADLSYADLKRADFRGAVLSGTNLSGADLTGADLRAGKIVQKSRNGELVQRERSNIGGEQTILTGARLKNANLSKVRAHAADFSNADLAKAIMNQSNFSHALFEGANLEDADLSGSDITMADMSEAIISGTNFSFTERLGLKKEGAITADQMGKTLESLERSLEELLDEHRIWIESAGAKGVQLDLSGYDLRKADDLRAYPLTAIRAVKSTFIHLDLGNSTIQSGVLDGSDFRDCYLENADLRGSSFRVCRFTRSNLRGARLNALQFKNPDSSLRLKRVDLSGSDLRLCDFSKADLRDSILMGVDLSGSDLSGADLRRADLSGAILKGVDLTDALLEKAIIDYSSI